MTWEEVNKLFGLCAHDACPAAAGCLRHQAAQLLPEDKLEWRYVNHALTRQAGPDGCPAFVDARPQRIARGFRIAQRQVPRGEINDLREAVCEAMQTSESTYYKMLRGVRPLSEAEQAVVAAQLVRFGAREPVEFDEYEERIHWPI